MKLLPFLLAPLVASLIFCAPAVRAGYSDGLAAMEQGDYAAAFQEFEALASAGHREAQFTLAFLYDFGQGTEANPEQALKWYRAAADQGLEEAQLALALMFADGRGVDQDYESAAGWYRRAAQQGNALAQNDLADLYRQGKGVPQDFVQAFLWYDAAIQNLPSGEVRDAVTESRDAVAAQLSDQQRSEATERARSFRPEAEIPPARPATEAPEQVATGSGEEPGVEAAPPSNTGEVANQDTPQETPKEAPEGDPGDVTESDAAPTVAEQPDGPEAVQADKDPAPGDSAAATPAPSETPSEAAPETPLAEAPPAEATEASPPELADADAAPRAMEPQDSFILSEQPAPDPTPDEAQIAALPEPDAPEQSGESGLQWPQLGDREAAQVARVQRLLSSLGYNPGPPDGLPGGRTKAAVEAFEADHGWPRSGAITDSLEQTLARVSEGRKRVRFGQTSPGQTSPGTQAAGQRPSTIPGAPAVNPGFRETLNRLLAEGGSAGAATRQERPQTAARPDGDPDPSTPDPGAAESGVSILIDERMASLDAIVRQVDTVSAAGLGWNLLNEWERAAAQRFRQKLNASVASELQAELTSRRQSQIVLGDPYGNFLRVTDSYRIYLETLKARFQ